MYKSYEFTRLMLMAALLAGVLNLSLTPASDVQAAGTISLTDFNTYSQNFDTLSNVAGSTANPLSIPGWEMTESGGGARDNDQYAVDTGGTTTGDTYSYGLAGSTDRALGSLRSGTLISIYGVSFTNNTGGAIGSLAIAYIGEQWRLGATGRADRLDFQYSLDATSLSTGTWVDVNPLDFSSPVTTGTTGALNGNSAGNRTMMNSVLPGLNIPDGYTFWIRWLDEDADGFDDGLAVDDFSLTPSLRLPQLSANDVTLLEDNATTKTFSFLVSLDISALTGGVTFDIATAEGTAKASDNDYVANSQHVTIPAGETAYTFDVTVKGDTTSEPDEIFYVNVTNIVGANTKDAQAVGTILNDDFVITPIYTIQGNGAGTPLTGELTTTGVVIADFEGGVSPQLRGFYIQDPVGDGNPATSDGLFVYDGNNANAVSLGDLVRVTGMVSEYQGQTEISVNSATDIMPLSYGNIITPTEISLPFTSIAQQEQYEGMLVRFPQALFVTDTWQLGRFGQVTLSSMDRLYQPTSIVAPGAPALLMQASNDLNQIIVDDALNTENPDPILFGHGGNPLSAGNTLRGGDTVTGLVGVFTYTWGGNSSSPNAYRIRPVNTQGGIPDFVAANARQSTPPAVGGALKVVSMTLGNYFNTFTGCTAGVNGALVPCHGADNTTEFTRQADKIISTLMVVNADVIGILEIENDGYDSTSAIQDLVTRLNAAAGAGTYTFINPDTANGVNSLGTNAVKVGILYKPARVTPVGVTATLNSAEFINAGDVVPRNHASLLQAFQTWYGERFLLNVVYLKDKDVACQIPDAGDGQGECNDVRVHAVNELLDWYVGDPTDTGDPDILVAGDLNSYAREDPIAAFESGGFVNMVNYFGDIETYSGVFNGQWGYLDYALGSVSLLAQAADVENWHINADEPSVLDYNTNYKSAGQITSLYNVDPFRSADRDPVLIGLNLDTNGAPFVASSVRVNLSPSALKSVVFTVTFSENVKGVGLADFHLTTSGVTNANVSGLSGSGKTYTVTVFTGSGNGTIRLDIPATATIIDLTGHSISGLPFTTGESYVISKEPVFTDVPFTHWANDFIERLYRSGVTGGCQTTPLKYCPDTTITRAEMAVFLMVAEHGTGYMPPAASGLFNDVPVDNGFAKWIEQLAAEGITGGCGGGNYCPNAPVTREQMAVFLLVAEHGSGYAPPTATGVFADVPADNPFAPWIEQLAAEGITGGCGGENFCPTASVTRAQMAVFLVTAFNLP